MCKPTKQLWQLVSFRVYSGTQIKPQAEVILKHKGKKLEAVSTGDGPVDACFKAVDRITGVSLRLLDYRLEAVTRGKDALGTVSLNLVQRGKNFSGRGSSTDIIEASILAYINALNKTA
jgi:2-isopropylmalate synthase